MKIKRPTRSPDYVNKYGACYWYSPEWVTSENSLSGSFVCKIKATKFADGEVILYFDSDNGSGYRYQAESSSQEALRKWYLERHAECVILGEDPDSIIKQL